MTFDELRDTLGQALATGKIGTPVALRVHAVVPGSSYDPAAWLDAVVSLAGIAFPEAPQKLTARSGERQCNVLLNHAGGQTLMFSAARCEDQSGSLQLLLIGNHGVIRLEGGESFQPEPPVPAGEVDYWRQQVAESCRQNAAVRLERP